MTTNAQVGHLWAAYNMGTTTKDSARSSNGNFHFDGDSIWSYRTKLAQFKRAENGSVYVQRNTRSYSITTTGKHQPPIWRALHGLQRLGSAIREIEFPGEFFDREPSDLATFLVEWAAEDRAKADNPRLKASTREHLLDGALTKLGNAQYLATVHGLSDFPTGTPEAILATFKAERAAAQAWATLAKFFGEYNAASGEFFDRPLRAVAEALTGLAWLAGAEVTRGYGYRYGNISNGPTLLRVNGETVETSRGAEFPLEHGLAALPRLCEALKITRKRGEPWEFGTGGNRLGHFRIDRIEPDGTVVAGCHRVPEFAVRWAAYQARHTVNSADLAHVADAVIAIRAAMPLAAPNE